MTEPNPNSNPNPNPNSGDTLPQEAIVALEAGKFVKAVQCVMNARRASDPEHALAEAKALVDAYIATRPELHQRQEAAKQRTAWWVIALGAVVIGLLAWSKQ